MAYERTIKIAFDRISGEVVEADELFKSQKDAFEIRRQFHLNELELFCFECGQKLEVATSKHDRLHFRHVKHADFCILKERNLTTAEIEEFCEIYRLKESERHKQLKTLIAERLTRHPGVDVESIFIDNKFIVRGDEKRRPDVYCKYENKELVFEIQLSQLSLRYILNRFEFYKKHGIYLIWILDNFNLHRQKSSQLERDIKYLTKYQNFFKLDEVSEDFKLSCEYKFPFLTEDNKLLTKWKNESISLCQLSFDSVDYQVYYYNFGDNEALQKQQQKNNAEAILHAEHDRLVNSAQQKQQQEEIKYQEQIELAERLRLKGGLEKVTEIINWISRLKKSNGKSFGDVSREINQLSESELRLFNENAKLDKLDANGNPAIHRWIDEITSDSGEFIFFILSQLKIEIDVNVRSSEGRTVYQHLFKKDAYFKYSIMRLVLKRGYVFGEDDEEFFKSSLDNNSSNEGTSIIYKICSSIENKNLIDWILNHEKLILILESSKQNRIIGFGHTNWISFANNAIQYYDTFFEYIKRAFQYYGLWETIKQGDKKGTFRDKLFQFYKNFPKQDFECEPAIRAIYPEVFDTELPTT